MLSIQRSLLAVLGIAMCLTWGIASASAQDCEGTCRIEYDGAQWQIAEDCPDPNQCHCVIPVVSGEAACAPKDCEPNPVPGDTSFKLIVGAEDEPTQRSFLFQVEPSQPASFTMHPVNIDLGAEGSWTVNVVYNSTINYAPRVIPSVIVVPDPLPATTQATIGFKGGGFTKITHYDATGINSREYRFKRFKVVLTRNFPPPPPPAKSN